MAIAEIFKDLGLKEEHSKIYTAALEWGETSITNLAERAGIPRTSAYPYVEELIEIGLLKQSMKRGKKNLLPADPELLLELLEKRSNEIQRSIAKLNEDTLMDLKAMQRKDNKPKLQYLEGAEGIKKAYEMSLKASGETMVQCFTEDYKGIVSPEFFDEYFDKFFGSGKPTRELLTSDEGDNEYADKWGTEKNLQAFVDIDKSIETDVIIYDETVIFVSFNKVNPYALVIEDPEIVKSMTVMYDLAWKQASKK